MNERWDKLPPLVRAAVAGSMALKMKQRAEKDRLDLPMEEAITPRRADVARRFIEAVEVLADAFADLANAADEEAVAAGVDRLVGGDGEG